MPPHPPRPRLPPYLTDSPIADPGPDQTGVALGSTVTLDWIRQQRSRWPGPHLPVDGRGRQSRASGPQSPGPDPLCPVGARRVCLPPDRRSGGEKQRGRQRLSGAGNQAPVAQDGIDAIYRLDAVIFLDAASSTDADGALPSPPCGSLYQAQDGRRFPWGDDEPGLLLSIDPPSSCSRGRRWRTAGIELYP